MNPFPSEVLASYTNTVTQRVVDALGESVIEAIFLTGSVARDDVAGFRDGDTVEIHSDVDISVLVTPAADLEAARRKIRELVAQIPSSGPGYRVVPEPDIGVYDLHDLDAQAARPGTVEIPHARILFGRVDLAASADRYDPGRIDKDESLYLIENRLIESRRAVRALSATPEPTSERHAAYVLLKACLDAVTSVLIFHGTYSHDRSVRMERWHRDGCGDVGAALSDDAIALIATMDERRADLQSYLADAGVHVREDGSRVAVLLLELWRFLAGRLYEAEGAGWEELLMRRCRRGRSRRNLSELRAMGRRLSVPATRLLLGAGRLGVMSPVEVLRLTGVAETLHEHDGDADSTAYNGYLDRLTRTFGWTRGDIYDRGYAMFEATT